MERQQFIGMLASGLLAAPLVADAQLAMAVRRIGVLGTTPAASWEAFRQGLRELGYVEGQTIVIEWRWSEGKTERLPELVAELVRLPVEVIVVTGYPATRAAQEATATIPIVMPTSSDPVSSGFVRSLARPGGNITGNSTLGVDLTPKRLQLLKEMAPAASRVAVLYNAADRAMTRRVEEVEQVGHPLGVTVHRVGVRDASEFDGALAAATRARADALLVVVDPFIFVHRRRIVDFAARSRLPAMYELREFVDEGGLMTYGPNNLEMFRHAATYIDRILKRPADLPMEQPTKFELVINLKTAKALGLTIPQSVLLRADQVIE